MRQTIPQAPRSAVHRFWLWWTAELRAVFGPRPRQPRPPARRVRIEGGDVIVTDRKGRESARQVLLPDAPDRIAPPKSLALVLPRSEVLVRELTVPRRAAADLGRVVDYQFDAHIPLNRADCYAAWRELGREGDTVRVQLVAARRDRIDRHRLALSALKLSPAWVMCEDVPLNLIGPRAPTGERGAAGLAVVLLGVTLAGLAVAAWYPAWQLGRYNAALADQADAALARASAAVGLRNRAEAARERIATLDRFAGPSGALEELNRLAGTLPDDTNLQRYGWTADGTVSMSADAPTASGLMERLSAIPGWSTPQPTTSVSAQSDGRERLSLQLTRGAR